MASYQLLPWRADRNADGNRERRPHANTDKHWMDRERTVDESEASRHRKTGVSEYETQVPPGSHANAPRNSTTSFDEVQGTPKLKDRWRGKVKWWTDSWTPEIVALLCSWASLFGSVRLFFGLRDSSPSEWTSRLSPTTVVAILAKVAQGGVAIVIASCVGQLGWVHFVKRRSKKQSITPSGQHESKKPGCRLVNLEHFHQASTGPLGATLLLFAVPSFITLLCFITILASLGFEAALQQCLSVLEPQYIPRVYHLAGAINSRGSEGFTFGNYPITDAIPMTTRAINTLRGYGGQFSESPPSSFDYPPFSFNEFCRGQGCHPPPYATLGFCPSCQDLSLQSTSDSDGTVLLPNGSTVSVDDTVMMRFIPMTVQQNFSQSWQGALNLADIVVLGQFDETAAENLPRSISDVKAQRCQINLCVQIYRLEQNAIELGPPISETLLTNTDQASRVDTQATDDTAYWSIQIPESIDLTTDDPLPSSAKTSSSEVLIPRGDSSNFTIDNAAFTFLCNYFFDFLNGDAGNTSSQMSSVPQDSIESSLLENFAAAYSSSSTPSFQDTLSIVCKAIETYIRDVYPSTEIYDILDNQGSKYRVRWPWIALPAAVEVLATILLFTAIIYSSRARLPLWKTSILAALLRSSIRVDEKDWEGVGRAELSVLEEKAGEIYAELRLTDSGYRLLNLAEAAEGY